MSFIGVLGNLKTKLLKTVSKKDRNYLLCLSVGFIISFSVIIAYFSGVFENVETYLQGLIYQFGYKLPEDTGLVTIVKKDQTTSSAINRDPARREYASVINLLGSTIKTDRLFKSRSATFEMLSIDLGIFKDIRNQRPIATSYDEWAGFKDNSPEANDKVIHFFNQDKWDSASRQVLNYFKASSNQDIPGFNSFIKVSGKSWLPKGGNVLKVLAGGSKYLLLPTFTVPWASKAIEKQIQEYITSEESSEAERKVAANNKYNGGNQSPTDLLERWVNLLDNIRYAEVVFDFKLFPKQKDPNNWSFLSIVMKLKTYARDTSYTVDPASVVGFDFVLQGRKTAIDDQKLADALRNTNSNVILAALAKTEVINDEGAKDEETFTQALDLQNEKPKDNATGEADVISLTMGTKNETYEEILIKPDNMFLDNDKKVDYAMIDVSVGNKAYVSEVPIILKVSEKVYDENNDLVSKQNIKPSFALRIALEKMDHDIKAKIEEELLRCKDRLADLKPSYPNYEQEKARLNTKINELLVKQQEKGYVDTQKEVFNRIKDTFLAGHFVGPLRIKDLSIPINELGRMYLDFTGSTRKGYYKKAAIDSVSLYECLEDDLLKEYQKTNPKEDKLNPAFAHRRVLGGKSVNKAGKVFVVGPFEVTDFDFYPTPVSLATPFCISPENLMGIEIHANSILSILNKKFIRYPSIPALICCIMASSLIMAFVLELVSPFVGVLITLLGLYAVTSYSYISYHYIRQLFICSPILLAIVLVWMACTLIHYVKQRSQAKTTKEMFSKFVSADVVQYMLDNPDLVRPGGTKTDLTIFFSDVAGFTSISEALSPEDLVVLLNEYLGAMTDLLFEYGGTLDKFIGDAVMAFWNFPKKQEDHAVRAVLCALAMQKKIAELQVGWAKRGLPKVAARCGINTQDVVVGYMGSQKAQMNFTCMGDGVNLASRLEGANKEYGTMMMVSDNTYQKVKDAVRGRFLDFLAVKGKKEPVKVYELVCKIGEEPEGWFERVDMYDRAIQLHLERKWNEAIALFEELLKRWPDDGPSKTYISRCNEYKDNPPPEGWDGRYILTHK